MRSKAVGLIETIGLAAAIEAADAALKAANVKLLGYENTRGGGMITVKVVGDVGAVKAAVSAGSAAALRVGQVKSCHIIPRPHDEIESLLQQITRGPAEKPKARPKTRRRKKRTSKAKASTETKSTEQDEEKPKPKRQRSTRKKAEPEPAEETKPEEPPAEETKPSE
jgi:microcompartment protein CcmL/EutN